MKLTQAVTAVAMASGVSAFWRMPCRSRSGLARMDPLVDEGEVSGHVHSIFGSEGFSMTSQYEDLVNTTDHPNTCTSCGVYEDNSAYWTPALYFQHTNGTVEIVDQVGGMLAYYLMYLENVKAFPEGFRMIAGNPWVRNFTGVVPDAPLSSWPTDPTDQFFLSQRAIGFNCLNYAIKPEASLYRHTLPTKEYMDANCKDGIRIELAFPSCGNGELDSPDHKSHVAWPSLVKEGNCPEGFDTHYPFLFYESIWATNNFAGVDGQFVLSYGDPVGTGYHGDFIMGWKSENFLQQAVDTCTNPSGEVSDCSLFTLKSDEAAAQCTFDVPDAVKDDDVTGPCDGLPVGVPIQTGDEQATPYPVIGQSGAPKTYSPPSSSSVSLYSGSKAPSYSAANPSVTATAPGGIIVAKYSSGAYPDSSATASSSASSEYFSAPSASITASPSLSAASANNDIVATSYLTQGNEVVELFIEEVDVTVTATAAPSAGAQRRHLQRHQHHHGVHHF